MRNRNQSTALGDRLSVFKHGLANAISHDATGFNPSARALPRLAPFKQPLRVLLCNLVEIQSFENTVGAFKKSLIDRDLPHLNTESIKFARQGLSGIQGAFQGRRHNPHFRGRYVISIQTANTAAPSEALCQNSPAFECLLMPDAIERDINDPLKAVLDVVIGLSVTEKDDPTGATNARITSHGLGRNFSFLGAHSSIPSITCAGVITGRTAPGATSGSSR